MQQTCAVSGTPFELSDADIAFLDKISPIIGDTKFPLPPPKLCPQERMRRRLMFRNQQTLYKRTCDSTGQPMLSIYSPDKEQKVYCPEAWWGDDWSAMEYARDYDFNRSFTEQFTELMRAVPHIAVLITNEQNCQYTNQTYNCRDCHLSSAIKDCEGALYTQNANKVTDTLDSAFCFESELLFECTDCYDCYNCKEARHCFNCHDCDFVYDCIGCNNCFGSVGLRQQKHCFFNEQLSPEEYQAKVQAYNLHTWEGYLKAKSDTEAFLQKNLSMISL